MSRITELTGADRIKFAQRFWSKVDLVAFGNPEKCWPWIGATNQEGYGVFTTFPTGHGRKYHMARAARVAYELTIGEIPEGLTIDHLCFNPACVNPNHLEAVTQRENTLRGTSPIADRARQTHCKNGHEFTPENTRIRKDGSRKCRECSNRRDREKRLRKKRAKDVMAHIPFTYVEDGIRYDSAMGYRIGPAEDGAAKRAWAEREEALDRLAEDGAA